MTQSAPALLDLVTKTVGTPVSDGHGGFTVLPDNDMIMYRLMDIPTDNYSAFLKEAKEFLNMAMQMETHVRAVTYDQIVREARDKPDAGARGLRRLSSSLKAAAFDQ